MNTVHVNTLSDIQKKEVTSLVEECKKKEKLSLSAPTEDELEYYLVYDDEQNENGGNAEDVHRGSLGLVGFAFLFFPERTSCECSIFVHPDRRREGICAKLIGEAVDLVDKYEENLGEPVDFCFIADENTPSAMETLKAIGAEYWYSEYKMDRRFRPKDKDYKPKAEIKEAEPGIYTTSTDGEIIGSCAVLEQEKEIYVHSFQIKESRQGQGWGWDFLRGLIALLYSEEKVMTVQVCGLNYEARSLYRKAGFKDVESVAYYIY